MKALLHKSLKALALLSECPCTLDQLADKLCTQRRHVQKVIKGLREDGITVHSQTKNRIKYFWVASYSSFLPTVLSTSEQQAISTAITANNPDLQAAVYKLVQLTHLQIFLNIQKC